VTGAERSAPVAVFFGIGSVVAGAKARLGRPPEAVLEILE
jgi:hypothetical protein